jgi:uncharacterized protein (DUF433 family)
MTIETLTEEEKVRRVPGIVFADGPIGRRARIAGTGIEVFEVINSYLAAGKDLEALLRVYHWLTVEQILAALDYYREFPEEIHAILRARLDDVPEHLRDEFGGHLKNIL